MKEKDQNDGAGQEVGEEEPIATEEDDEGFHDTQAATGNWYLVKFEKLVVFENSQSETIMNWMIYKRYSIRFRLSRF